MDYYEIQLKRAWEKRCREKPDLANVQFLELWLNTLGNQGDINEYSIEEDGTHFIVAFTDGIDFGMVELEKP